MNSLSTDVPNTKQPLLLVTCHCKHIKDIVIPMEQWSVHIGHEETNDFVARRKAGMNIDMVIILLEGLIPDIDSDMQLREPILAALKFMWQCPEPPIDRYIEHSVQHLK